MRLRRLFASKREEPSKAKDHFGDPCRGRGEVWIKGAAQTSVSMWVDPAQTTSLRQNKFVMLPQPGLSVGSGYYKLPDKTVTWSDHAGNEDSVKHALMPLLAALIAPD